MADDTSKTPTVPATPLAKRKWNPQTDAHRLNCCCDMCIGSSPSDRVRRAAFEK